MWRLRGSGGNYKRAGVGARLMQHKYGVGAVRPKKKHVCTERILKEQPGNVLWCGV